MGWGVIIFAVITVASLLGALALAFAVVVLPESVVAPRGRERFVVYALFGATVVAGAIAGFGALWAFGWWMPADWGRVGEDGWESWRSSLGVFGAMAGAFGLPLLVSRRAQDRLDLARWRATRETLEKLPAATNTAALPALRRYLETGEWSDKVYDVSSSSWPPISKALLPVIERLQSLGETASLYASRASQADAARSDYSKQAIKALAQVSHLESRLAAAFDVQRVDAANGTAFVALMKQHGHIPMLDEAALRDCLERHFPRNTAATRQLGVPCGIFLKDGRLQCLAYAPPANSPKEGMFSEERVLGLASSDVAGKDYAFKRLHAAEFTTIID